MGGARQKQPMGRKSTGGRSRRWPALGWNLASCAGGMVLALTSHRVWFRERGRTRKVRAGGKFVANVLSQQAVCGGH